MVVVALVEAVIGLSAFTTVASKRPLARPVSVIRCAMPTPATRVANKRATTTIFRWVTRSAVKSEELFIMPSPGSQSLVVPRGAKVHGVLFDNVGVARRFPKTPHGGLIIA